MGTKDLPPKGGEVYFDLHLMYFNPCMVSQFQAETAWWQGMLLPLQQTRIQEQRKRPGKELRPSGSLKQ